MTQFINFFSFLVVFSLLLLRPSIAAIDTFLYAGCSQQKYTPGSTYESNVDSALTSMVNSAATANFNNFKVSLPGSSPTDVVYGLYQCRGNLGTPDCFNCVRQAVSQLGTICSDSNSGSLQLDGCFVRYDNVSFIGAEDKTVALQRCGPSVSYNSDALTRRDAVMGYLTAGGGGTGGYFRVGGSGNVQSVAQCDQDLSTSACQDCISDAIGRLKNECGTAAWGDMFLAKCYARYSESGYNNNNSGGSDNNNEMDETLAITIGGIAGVALLVFLLSAILKTIEKKGGK